MNSSSSRKHSSNTKSQSHQRKNIKRASNSDHHSKPKLTSLNKTRNRSPPPKASSSAPKLYVVLEEACFELVKLKGNVELLNSDDHLHYLTNLSRDPAEARPDIAHFALMILMDSPLNKSGRLQVYIRTQKNVLIYIHPTTRIPRTSKRFAGLMAQLLSKKAIHASNSTQKLFKIVKNPVTLHLPENTYKIGTSAHAESLIPLKTYVKQLDTTSDICFVIGVKPKGSVNPDYLDEQVAISEYPLSAPVVCGKVCEAFEEAWGIL